MFSASNRMLCAKWVSHSMHVPDASVRAHEYNDDYYYYYVVVVVAGFMFADPWWQQGFIVNVCIQNSALDENPIFLFIWRRIKVWREIFSPLNGIRWNTWIIHPDTQYIYAFEEISAAKEKETTLDFNLEKRFDGNSVRKIIGAKKEEKKHQYVGNKNIASQFTLGVGARQTWTRLFPNWSTKSKIHIENGTFRWWWRRTAKWWLCRCLHLRYQKWIIKMSCATVVPSRNLYDPIYATDSLRSYAVWET